MQHGSYLGWGSLSKANTIVILANIRHQAKKKFPFNTWLAVMQDINIPLCVHLEEDALLPSSLAFPPKTSWIYKERGF